MVIIESLFIFYFVAIRLMKRQLFSAHAPVLLYRRDSKRLLPNWTASFCGTCTFVFEPFIAGNYNAEHYEAFCRDPVSSDEEWCASGSVKNVFLLSFWEKLPLLYLPSMLSAEPRPRRTIFRPLSFDVAVSLKLRLSLKVFMMPAHTVNIETKDCAKRSTKTGVAVFCRQTISLLYFW